MGPDDYSAILGEYARLIDVNNMDIILRGKILKMHTVNIQKMIVREGRYIKKDKLLAAIRARHIEDAFRVFMVDPYDKYLREGYQKFEAKNELFYIENALNKYIKDRAVIILASYPFQVRTPLAYLDLKFIETINLKAILLGHLEGISPSEIREHII